MHLTFISDLDFKIRRTFVISMVALLFYNFSHFAMIPFLGLISENFPYYLSPVAVGLALSLKSISEKISLLGLSLIAKKITSKYFVVIGFIVRALVFTFIPQYRLENYDFILVLMLIVIGISGAFIRPNIRDIISQIDSKNRSQVNSLMFVCSNLGAILGPLLVSFFNLSQLKIIFFSLAAIDLLIAINVYFFVTVVESKENLSSPQKSEKLFYEIFKLVYLSNSELVKIYLVQFSFWVIVSLCIMLVSFINKLNPDIAYFRGYIFAIEGMTVVAAQLFFMYFKSSSKYFTRQNMILSVFLLFIGSALLFYPKNIFMLLMASILIGFSEAVIGLFIYNTFSSKIEIFKLPSQQMFSALLLFEMLGDTFGYFVSGIFLNNTTFNSHILLFILTTVVGIMTYSIWRLRCDLC